MTSRQLLVAAWFAAAATTTSAQQPVVTTAPARSYQSGWTLTPGFGFLETYDDNISLFGVRTAVDENNDLIATYEPSADLHYSGKHTTFGAGYAGSFLAFRTHTLLNQWDQQAHAAFDRRQSARLSWYADFNAVAVPTTDLIDLGGIPYRRTGATTADGRLQTTYQFDARNSVIASVGFQSVRFDQTELPGGFLQGGRAVDINGGLRHRLSSRFGIGADYGLRRSIWIDEPTPFLVHSVEGEMDYQLSPSWVLSGSAGVMFLQQNPETEGSTGPAWRFAAEQHRANTVLTAWYGRSYAPSFAFGGTMISREAGFGFHAPLFHSRYFFTDQSAIFRDDQPLTNPVNQLPVRSLRIHSVIGWSPQRWVHIEGYYTRAQGSTLRYGGQTYRNRIGFRIVTSKPLRIQ